MSELLASIKLMTPNGNRLELPTEQISNYPAVKRALITAGAKHKKNGFEFTEDAATVQARLLGGEVVNDKKKFQFFPTPEKIVVMMWDKVAELGYADLIGTGRVLEPSAGQGALAELPARAGAEVVTVELMEANCKVLTRLGYDPIQKDFMACGESELGKFDIVIANPPFTKNQDIEHIQHMYKFAKDGGCVVSMSSPSWLHGSQKKQMAFKEWLKQVGGTFEHIAAGEFKSSGTQVATLLVSIKK